MHRAEQERSTAQWPLQEARSKVEEIISHAEAAAGNILDGAEVEAERYVREVCRESEREALEHARALSELSDNLIAQAEALSRQSRLILEHLNAVGEGSDGTAVEREQEPSGDEWEQPEDVPRAETQPSPFQPPVARREHSIDERYSPGARLLATQMAVAGSERAEIRDRLVNDFEIRDPDPLLEAIIGRS